MTPKSAALSQAAQRFNAMLYAKTIVEDAPRRSCAVRVSAGLHRGAVVQIRNVATLGSLEDNDIVLRDPDVLERHAELRRVDGVWALFFTSTGLAVPAFETIPSGRCIRRRYAIGTAQVVITQASPGVKSALRRFSKPLNKLLAPMLLATAAVLASVVVVYFVQPASANVVNGTRNLSQEGWPDVELITNQKLGAVARGYVNNEEELMGLQRWLSGRNIRDAVMEVRVGAKVLARVKEALADATIGADYVGAGTVRLNGTSDKPAVITRIKQLSSDLVGVVRVDNQVAFSKIPDDKPRQHELPFRIVDVQHETKNSSGSFSTDNNARYFVGAVLADGSEVLAIRSDRIEFSSGDRLITYPLK